MEIKEIKTISDEWKRLIIMVESKLEEIYLLVNGYFNEDSFRNYRGIPEEFLNVFGFLYEDVDLEFTQESWIIKLRVRGDTIFIHGVDGGGEEVMFHLPMKVFENDDYTKDVYNKHFNVVKKAVNEVHREYDISEYNRLKKKLGYCF